jgi:hypothetical protein
MILNLIHESGCKKQVADKHVYIVDKSLIERLNYGFHRLHHVLNFCVMQDIEIYEGDTLKTCLQLIQDFSITTIIIQESDDLKFKQIINSLSSQVSIQWIKHEFEEFIQSPSHSSFFSFFKMIEPSLRRSKHE